MRNDKYIFSNDIMKPNPAYQTQRANTEATSSKNNSALAIVSSRQDLAAAAELGHPGGPAETTTASIAIMKDESYINAFQTPQISNDRQELFDGLSRIFEKYEAPIGLINKLLALSQHNLNFMIDDCSSMLSDSTSSLAQVTPYIEQRRAENGMNTPVITKWEDVEDRLHIMIDMLAYIPVITMTINFLNRADKIILDHNGKTPQQFSEEAHQQVTRLFNQSPSSGNPYDNNELFTYERLKTIHEKLENAFRTANRQTMHYFFTDVNPNNIYENDLFFKKEQILKDITNSVLWKERGCSAENPITFVNYADGSAGEWMRHIESISPYTTMFSYFDIDCKNILEKQGPAFPYTKGFWILSQLLAVINRDLDLIDDRDPLPKGNIDYLLGYKLTSNEYKYYFQNVPNSSAFAYIYPHYAWEGNTIKDIERIKPQLIRELNHEGYFANRGFWANTSQLLKPLDNHLPSPTKPHRP